MKTYFTYINTPLRKKRQKAHKTAKLVLLRPFRHRHLTLRFTLSNFVLWNSQFLICPEYLSRLYGNSGFSISEVAQQLGPIKITGTIHGISFYKMSNNYYVRMKGGPSRKQVLKDKNFERTRENASEFAHFSHAAKIISNALRILKTTDKQFYRKAFALLLQLKTFDTLSVRGKRNLISAFKHPEAQKQLSTFIKEYNVLCSFNADNTLTLIFNQKQLQLTIDFEKGKTFVTPIPEKKSKPLTRKPIKRKDVFVLSGLHKNTKLNFRIRTPGFITSMATLPP